MATYTVVKGDTLWTIAKKKLGDPNRWPEIASKNSLKSPYVIRVNQTLNLPDSGGGGGSTPSTKPVETNKVTNLFVGFITPFEGDPTELVARWSWNRTDTKSYKAIWYYDNGNGIWFVGNDEEITVDKTHPDNSKISTYSPPSGTNFVMFKITPIADTHKVKQGDSETEVANWTAVEVSSGLINTTNELNMIVPGAPSIEAVTGNNKRLELSVEFGKDEVSKIDYVEFQLVKDDKYVCNTTPMITSLSTTGKASYECSIDIGSKYKARCRTLRRSYKSSWSEYSSEYITVPTTPKKITTCKRLKVTTPSGKVDNIYLEWTKVDSATTYDIQYVFDNPDYFNIPSEIHTISDIETNKRTLTNKDISDTGHVIYFRVSAKNSAGNSGWSSMASIANGSKPNAPTTWSSVSSVTTDGKVSLNWTHNPTDNSDMVFGRVEIKIGDAEWRDRNANREYDPATGEVSLVWNTGEPIITGATLSATDNIYTCTLDFGSLTPSELESLGIVGGTVIKWRIATAGVVANEGGMSEYSEVRSITVYPVTTLGVSFKTSIYSEEAIDELKSFPAYIALNVEPITAINQPIGYHVSVLSDTTYETVDDTGTIKVVGVGDEVYSKNFDTSRVDYVELSANNVDLQNGASYTILCTVTMSSGLTVSSNSYGFSVNWEDPTYQPSAEIAIDKDIAAAYIKPYCEITTIKYYKRNSHISFYKCISPVLEGTEWNVADWELQAETPQDADSLEYYIEGQAYSIGDIVKNNTEWNDEDWDLQAATPILFYKCISPVLEGTEWNINDWTLQYVITPDPDSGEDYTEGEYYMEGQAYSIDDIVKKNPELYNKTHAYIEGDYITKEDIVLVENVILSVYRREYDGSLTEIATDLSNDRTAFVTDPHPALNYARYRIIAKDLSTGGISYYDLPPYYVGEKAIILQWDEQWSDFDDVGTIETEEKAWNGSLLRLPYNVDVTNSYSQDVVTVDYVGRKHPVSYYGTHLGETASWSTDIDKTDMETIYALRRLSVWMGDVYVREPSGTGYWANVKISFSQTHCELTIPVSIDITRVEGGI